MTEYGYQNGRWMMMPGLSAASEIAFSLAGMEAKALGASNIDAEHLFLGLCKVADFVYVDLKDFPIQDPGAADGAQIEMQEYSSFLSDREFDVKKFRRTLRRILLESRTEVEVFTGHRTDRCREVFSVAGRSASLRSDKVRLRDLLAAAIAVQSASLDRLFTDLSFNRSMLYPVANDQGPAVPAPKEKEKDTGRKGTATPLLDQLGRDITRLAREGKLDPVIGRKEEIRRIGQVLAQRRKNTPILVGDAGVGKTCIVEGFAIKAAHPQAPPAIRNLRIVELSFGALVGGTKLRGDLEERLTNIIREASSDPNVVLFFDEIHSIVGGGSRDAVEIAIILKPALARGDIKLVGATTMDEYRKYVEKDPAMERRFQVIWVEEPTREEACEILEGLRPGFEAHHSIRIPDQLVAKVVDLTMRFLPDFRLPDKAIDVLDQTCAKKALRTLSPVDFLRSDPVEIDLEDLAEVVSERSRIPLKNILATAGDEYADLEATLANRVFGQQRAIHEVVHTLQISKAGLKDAYKPAAVFLFVGPTGSGKTELAKALSEALFHDERRLISIDMSEYQEKHSVAKLLGAPPGFIGYEDEAILIKRVRTNPHSVVLFDEIEKAHPDIFDVFLQIFDEGKLTDTHGRTIRFSETILILTTNLGAGDFEEEKPAIGFEGASSPGVADRNSYEPRIQQQLARTFRPEFLNRIQKTIYFLPLDKKATEHILENYVHELNRQLMRGTEVQIFLTDPAKDFLLLEGYSEVYGAREMKRVFDRYVTEPLSTLLTAGKFWKKGTVRVDIQDEEAKFDFLGTQE